MSHKQHVVQLNEQEQAELERIVKTGTRAARVMRRAQSLLWSNAGKTDAEIAALQGINPVTVSATRRRWAEKRSLEDEPRLGGKKTKRLNDKQEAHLIALACSDAPDGRETWTMQLLADHLLELQIITEPISDETVRRTLKKTFSSPGKKSSGVSQQ